MAGSGSEFDFIKEPFPTGTIITGPKVEYGWNHTNFDLQSLGTLLGIKEAQKKYDAIIPRDQQPPNFLNDLRSASKLTTHSGDLPGATPQDRKVKKRLGETLLKMSGDYYRYRAGEDGYGGITQLEDDVKLIIRFTDTMHPPVDGIALARGVAQLVDDTLEKHIAAKQAGKVAIDAPADSGLVADQTTGHWVRRTAGRWDHELG